MAYFKINDIDFSSYVSIMKVGKKQHYKSMLTAAGNTLVKPINTKYVIEVGFIALTAEQMKALQPHIGKLRASISFLEPSTNQLKKISCMLTNNLVEYYTIQDDGLVLYKPFSLQFNEL